ncbi:uncharacterized protein LOC120153324 [Hibiscus syriacus]|uniref:uncharacterized protein LOC120153324 n=1 Tax=Hibiscus syriacus TaxID=106335 RepID=UPI001923276B|nr:uncharacterized protein LOC120153324 [Hibiscus syriacus]
MGGTLGRFEISRSFYNFIFNNALLDMDYHGSPFTWPRGNLSHRLDQCLVNSAWNNMAFSFEVFHLDSLVALQPKLLYWNSSNLGEIGKRNRQLFARLRRIARVLDVRHSPFLSTLESQLKEELKYVIHIEEYIWFQKSHCDYTLYGDRNTAFFHARVKSHRKHNSIQALKDGYGNWCFDQHSQ